MLTKASEFPRLALRRSLLLGLRPVGQAFALPPLERPLDLSLRPLQQIPPQVEGNSAPSSHRLHRQV